MSLRSELNNLRYKGRLSLHHVNRIKGALDKEKAFDIIKAKKVSVWLLFKSNNVVGYNHWTSGEPLTQEEFDYLRGMLV